MKSITLSLLSIAALLSLNSCVSTDILEPESSQDTEKRLVLNLTAPAEAATRAQDGYKLRYTAKLYSGNDGNANTLEVQRQELIDGETGPGGVENQLVFYVPEGYQYTIFVFADYIPESFEPKSTTGLYDDYFYDTAMDSKNVMKMLPTPGNKKINELSPSFFNNDFYDCFGGVAVLEEKKTSKEVRFDLELYRLVSKVRFVDTSSLSGSIDVKLASFKYLQGYTLRNNKNYETGGFLETYTFKNNLTIFRNKDFTGEEEQEILFFYTFASIGSTEKPGIELILTDYINQTEANSIYVDKIDVKRNHITTVKGNLLPGLAADDPNQDQDENKNGPIILNMTTSKEDWQKDETTWSPK